MSDCGTCATDCAFPKKKKKKFIEGLPVLSTKDILDLHNADCILYGIPVEDMFLKNGSTTIVPWKHPCFAKVNENLILIWENYTHATNHLETIIKQETEKLNNSDCDCSST